MCYSVINTDLLLGTPNLSYIWLALKLLVGSYGNKYCFHQIKALTLSYITRFDKFWRKPNFAWLCRNVCVHTYIIPNLLMNHWTPQKRVKLAPCFHRLQVKCMQVNKTNIHSKSKLDKLHIDFICEKSI